MLQKYYETRTLEHPDLGFLHDRPLLMRFEAKIATQSIPRSVSLDKGPSEIIVLKHKSVLSQLSESELYCIHPGGYSTFGIFYWSICVMQSKLPRLPTRTV